MAEQDVKDGQQVIDRLSTACDTLGDLGFSEIAAALAAETRRRRGRIRAHVYPARLARALIELAEQAERLALALAGTQCDRCAHEFRAVAFECAPCPNCGSPAAGLDWETETFRVHFLEP